MTRWLNRLTEAIERLNPNGDREPNGGNGGGDSGAEEEERQPRQRRQQIESTSNIKMRIPPFKGTSSPEEYLEWVQRVEKVFECHEYSEARKCQLAALEFTDYANLWWENLKAQRRRDGEEEVRSWRLMKRLMQRRFVPDYYKQELYIKLQGLRQGGMCVEDYVKEFEMLKIRCELQEPEEQTIARFLGGLNREIADLVELQTYVFLEDVIKLAVKVERQRKRVSTKQHVTRQVGNKITNSSTPWENKKLSNKEAAGSSTTLSKGKAVDSNPPKRSRDIKCFKCHGHGHIASECPNRRAMIIKGAQGEVESEDEGFEEEGDERLGEERVEYANEGEML